MSIRIMSQVWENGPANRSELLVMLALADFANDEGECWPAVGTIAKKVRMTERGVQKIVGRLVNAGRLSVLAGGGRRNSNLYRILASPEPETPNAVHPEPHSPRTPEQKPRTGVQESPNGGSPKPSGTIKEPSVERDARASRFAEFWNLYPHRGGAKVKRKGGEVIYGRLVRAGVPEQAIIDGASRYRDDAKVQRGYAQDATKWLNQRGWEDEVEPARRRMHVGSAAPRSIASIVAQRRLEERQDVNETARCSSRGQLHLGHEDPIGGGK